MRRLQTISACLALAACHPRNTSNLPEPAAYAHVKDRVLARMWAWGLTSRFPCWSEQSTGVDGLTWTEQCFRFSKPQRMSGLWRHNFEVNQFCLPPAKQCPDPANANDPYQGSYGNMEFRAQIKGEADTPYGGLYAIDFIGRRSEYPIFGGTNDADRDVIVDRVLAIRIVDPPRTGQMTKDHVEGYLKECSHAALCMPNSEVPHTR
jgi:hypothetical protein